MPRAEGDPPLDASQVVPNIIPDEPAGKAGRDVSSAAASTSKRESDNAKVADTDECAKPESVGKRMKSAFKKMSKGEKAATIILSIPFLPFLAAVAPIVACVACTETDNTQYYVDLTPEERAQNDEVQLGAIPFTKTGERRRKDANVGAKGLGRRRTPRRKSGSLPSPAANEVWEASKRDGSGSNTPRSSRDVSYRDGASGSRPRSREGSLRGGSGILKNGATNSPIAASAVNPLATLPLQRDETPAKKSLFAGESAAEDDARARGDASS